MTALYAIEETVKTIDINGDVQKETFYILYDDNDKPFTFKTRENAKNFMDQHLAEFINLKLAELNAVLYRIDNRLEDIGCRREDADYLYRLSFSRTSNDEERESIIIMLSSVPYYILHNNNRSPN